MLATTNLADILSLCVQIIALVLAAIVGRFWLRSRSAILVAAFAGAVAAMVADMLVDGQAAFFFVAFVPVVYFVAVIGRGDI